MNAFDFAQKLDASGQRFFEKLSRKSEHVGPSSVYRMIARDEAEIRRRLGVLRLEAGELAEHDSEVFDRIKNPFESEGLEKEALRAENDLDAYRFVVGVEKKVCEIFKDAASEETDTKLKGLFSRLAREECRELQSIESVKDFAEAPESFLAWGEFSNLEEFHNFGRDEGASRPG